MKNKKEVNIDSIMTFIAWLRSNDILFLKDNGVVDTNTNITKGVLNIEISTEDLSDLLTDFQDEGYLPEEVKIEHVIKEIEFRQDEIDPVFSRFNKKVIEENWNSQSAPVHVKWNKKSKKKEGGIWGADV